MNSAASTFFVRRTGLAPHRKWWLNHADLLQFICSRLFRVPGDRRSALDKCGSITAKYLSTCPDYVCPVCWHPWHSAAFVLSPPGSPCMTRSSAWFMFLSRLMAFGQSLTGRAGDSKHDLMKSYLVPRMRWKPGRFVSSTTRIRIADSTPVGSWTPIEGKESYFNYSGIRFMIGVDATGIKCNVI